MTNFIHDRIRYLLETFLFVPVECIEMDLVESGVIDSAGFMELFFLLEKEFGIEVKAVDLELENFRTINRIAEFIMSKQAKQEAKYNG